VTFSNEESRIFYKDTCVGGKLGELYITINRATAIPTASIDFLKNLFNVYGPDVDLPSWFNNVGILSLLRFKRTGDLRDIDSAVFHHQSAVEYTLSTPGEHVNLPTWHNDLGNSFFYRFERTGNSGYFQCNSKSTTCCSTDPQRKS
jgi:hypothetical protein